MKRRRLTKRGADETRILEEPIRGGESKSDPMEDNREGVEERKTEETKQGGEGAGRQAQVTSQAAGNTYLYKINLKVYLQNAILLTR